jgi:lipid A 3-O-deacylase
MLFKRCHIIYLLGLYVGGWTASVAQDRIELAIGTASQGIGVLRLAWQHPWSSRWLVSSEGEMSGYHALSYNRWAEAGESIDAVAYSPVFVYRFHAAAVSYLKFGIGAAYLSDTQIQGRGLSTHFQFEDQLGIGWQWDRHELGLVYMHYSNAGIEKPNQGIDMILLSYVYQPD